MEWIREKISVFKKKFGTDIKLRRIEYFKTYGTPEEQRTGRPLVPIPSAIPQPIAIRPPRTQSLPLSRRALVGPLLYRRST